MAGILSILRCRALRVTGSMATGADERVGKGQGAGVFFPSILRGKRFKTVRHETCSKVARALRWRVSQPLDLATALPALAGEGWRRAARVALDQILGLPKVREKFAEALDSVADPFTAAISGVSKARLGAGPFFRSFGLSKIHLSALPAVAGHWPFCGGNRATAIN